LGNEPAVDLRPLTVDPMKLRTPGKIPIPPLLARGPMHVIRETLQFLQMLLARFMEDNGPQNAASLAYTTLLSLVPLMAVTLALVAAFPVSARLGEQVQTFVFENFMPDFGLVVQEYLVQFSERATQLSGAGVAFLVLVAVLLMSNIDRAFGMIWKVRRQRSPLSRFMVYWSILSLGPLLMGLSVAATSYLLSLPLFTEDAQVAGLTQRLLRLAPILASTLAFTLVYLVVPNRRIPLSHAVTGGLVASLLFELAKHGFGLYLTRFPTHQAIYGALATVPVFLIWLYISWMITLLGGELVHLLGLYQAGDVPGRGRADDGLVLAVDLLDELWQAQHAGETLSTRQLLERRGEVGEDRLEGLLMELQDARLVLCSDDAGWALARDLHEVRLYDLFRSRSFGLPLPQSRSEPLAELLARIDLQLEQAMGLSLSELYRQRAEVRAGG